MSADHTLGTHRFKRRKTNISMPLKCSTVYGIRRRMIFFSFMDPPELRNLKHIDQEEYAMIYTFENRARSFSLQGFQVSVGSAVSIPGGRRIIVPLFLCTVSTSHLPFVGIGSAFRANLKQLNIGKWNQPNHQSHFRPFLNYTNSEGCWDELRVVHIQRFPDIKLLPNWIIYLPTDLSRHTAEEHLTTVTFVKSKSETSQFVYVTAVEIKANLLVKVTCGLDQRQKHCIYSLHQVATKRTTVINRLSSQCRTNWYRL